MPRTLSSNLTFFWKFIFPVFWFSGSGLATLQAFTESQGATQHDKWVFLASWPLSYFLLSLFPIIRLKRVRVDGEFLYVSNYLREAKVPLRNVWAVNVLTVRPLSARGAGELSVKPFAVVEFQGQTPFGNRIVFMARGLAVLSGLWKHPVVTELRQVVDRALLASTTPGQLAPRDLGRAREEAHEAEARARLLAQRGTWGSRPAKPTLQLQERYIRRSRLLWHLFGIPGGGFLVGLVLAVFGARAASIDSAEVRTVATGAWAAILIGFTLFLGAYFVQVLRSWLAAPARLVPYFERPLNSQTWGAFRRTMKIWDFGVSSEPLDVQTWGAFKRGFVLAQEFDALERRASQLGVAPLSAFGFGDDVLGQVVIWHTAETGLKTVRALIASAHREPLDPNLLKDLQALEAVVERAEAAAVRFAMVLRIGSDDWISHAEMCERKGSFW